MPRTSFSGGPDIVSECIFPYIQAIDTFAQQFLLIMGIIGFNEDVHMVQWQTTHEALSMQAWRRSGAEKHLLVNIFLG